MAKATFHVTFARLRELLTYDPETGHFTWLAKDLSLFKNESMRDKWNRRCAGKRAGGVNNRGYRQILIDGKTHSCHRLAWLYMTGSLPRWEIDHLNGDRDDNRFANLRHVTPLENGRNKRRPHDNKSGVLGVSCIRGRWRAQIGVNYRTRYLGSFDTFEQAVSARKTAERQYGYHENHGRAA